MNVAWVFQKRHDNVMRDIKGLECSEEFRLLNFEESTYTNAQGRSQPMYSMTRDGFTFLAMGFTGKKAAAFKETYIVKFNEMEKQLQGTHIVPLTGNEDFIALLQANTKAIEQQSA